MNTPFWTRYRTLQDRVAVIRDNATAATIDVAVLSLRLPADNFPEWHLMALAARLDEVAADMRRAVADAQRKRADRDEAAARVDAMLEEAS